ncbi:MAG: acyl-CoA dehydrogenase [Myxococcales bacterium]|nr:acyl-CoA dehydrogenase [Myxococcales bacterium]
MPLNRASWCSAARVGRRGSEESNTVSSVPYTVPVQDMRFTLEQVVKLEDLTALPGFEEAGADMVQAVLEEAAKLASSVLAPINFAGDRQHSKLVAPGVVQTPEGFKAAYDQYRDGGWNAVPFDPEYGGQGLPWAVAFAVQEMWQSANMAFGLCPMLNQGAVELLQAHGSEEQKKTWLEKLISGHWTGTMNLTEPQAGSDLSQVRAKAERAPDLGDEIYRIKGQKIFITYGEHDLAENIVHMVLARLPEAPEGTKGISLFIVPKFLVNEDGSLGARNDVQVVALEGKMGINASPTCTMAFGDESEGAVGYLVGAEHQGIKYMFTMMNNARLAVGLQGMAIAARAYDQAVVYAKDRIQSKSMTRPKDPPAPIIEHPDVRRMLLTMKAKTEAARALAYYAGKHLDLGSRHPDAAVRAKAQATVDLLTPVVKGWGTDVGCEVSSLGVQVHGGAGYVEETGAAQHFRDARIAPIYEGTNGIQANDLVFRKVIRDSGAAAKAFISDLLETAAGLEGSGNATLLGIGARMKEGAAALETATTYIVGAGQSDPVGAAAGAYNYMTLFGLVAGGSMLGKAALAAASRPAGFDAQYLDGKIATARFYAEQILPQAQGLVAPITQGAASLNEFAEAMF